MTDRRHAGGYTRLDMVAQDGRRKVRPARGRCSAHGPRLKQLAELKTRLTTDAAFLFGYTAKTRSTATAARAAGRVRLLLARDSPARGADDRGDYDAKFIQEMADHGFDTGTAWSGAFTDSMHFELVTGLF